MEIYVDATGIRKNAPSAYGFVVFSDNGLIGGQFTGLVPKCYVLHGGNDAQNAEIYGVYRALVWATQNTRKNTKIYNDNPICQFLFDKKDVRGRKAFRKLPFFTRVMVKRMRKILHKNPHIQIRYSLKSENVRVKQADRLSRHQKYNNLPNQFHWI